jgi:hypothetical protein
MKSCVVTEQQGVRPYRPVCHLFLSIGHFSLDMFAMVLVILCKYNSPSSLNILQSLLVELHSAEASLS